MIKKDGIEEAMRKLKNNKKKMKLLLEEVKLSQKRKKRKRKRKRNKYLNIFSYIIDKLKDIFLNI